MFFVKASPNEFLVAGRRGKITNKGVAASAVRWPGTSYVKISSTQQESTFEMTQETRDGIPLRFKGLVIYRVTRPELAARLFDFCGGSGHFQIQTMLSHVCLGELRAAASQMTMKECVEERKTTLTDLVAQALELTVRGAPDSDWGLEIDVVQVAQVFVVDDELRRQMEAEVRDQIMATSELSALRVQEELQNAQAESARRRLQQQLETSKEQSRISQEQSQLDHRLAEERARLQEKALLEKYQRDQQQQRQQIRDDHERQGLQQQLRLEREQQEQQHRLEREQLEQHYRQQRIAEENPLRLQEIDAEMELLRRRHELLSLKTEVRRLEVDCELAERKAVHELQLELLPLEQAPQLAAALAGLYRGLNLTVYGETPPMLQMFEPLLQRLLQTCQAPAPTAKGSNGVAATVAPPTES